MVPKLIHSIYATMPATNGERSNGTCIVLAMTFSGILMKSRKRSQAYPIACGPCLTAPGGWAGWYGWLGCGEHKFLCPYLLKCPGTRFASLSCPPSERRWAHGRVRTTLKSTESSSYGSLGLWHTLGSQLHHIYGWEASWTTLVYTTHVHSYMYKVGSEAHQALTDVAAPSSPTALPALLSPPTPPVGAGRPALRLPCASQRPQWPGGGRHPPSGGFGRPAGQPSSIGPRCAPPQPPAGASAAAASVPTTIGEVCAVLDP